jgi:hypothetical protein
VGFVHNIGEQIVADRVTSCFYTSRSCELTDILVSVLGFPLFTLGLGGPDLGRQMLLNSVAWAVGASVLAWATIWVLVRRD